jgi:hypothetical protein
MLAALARVAQLRRRIAEIDASALGARSEPRSLAGAIAETGALQRILVDLERDDVADRDSESDLSPVVVGQSPPFDRPWLAEKAPHRDAPVAFRGALLAYLAVFAVTLGMLLDYSQRPPETAPAAVAARHSGVVVHLEGVVVSRSGSADVVAGERCEITIADADDGNTATTCDVDVRCPSEAQRFRAASCPMAGRDLRMQMNGLAIDTTDRRATFILLDRAGSLAGGATLRLFDAMP